MRNTGFMSGLYVLSEWMMRFSVINVLWLFFNLPIVFIVVSIMFVERISNIFLLLPPLIVFMPLLFFPATTAMFASVRDWIMDKDDKGLIKSYWRYYKENYKKSLFGGMILTVLWFVWGVDYYYFSQENIILMFSFVIMGALLYVYTMNFFSVTVHYEMRLGAILKNSLLITLGSPILFFTVLLMNGIILLTSFNTVQFLIPFFTWSLLAFVSFSAFYRLYIKITSK
ncbi:YesL family protein [Oceanobacillus longus]|uniref:YesL family protein n=1 Tax=Oceanobacillus longus TaxID=930120 RepID=A0ABV8GVN5_9BACI